MTKIVESIRNAVTGELDHRTLEYGYNGELRLKTVRENGVLIADYAYDLNGNVVSSIVDATPTPQPEATSTATFDGSGTPTPTSTPTPTNTPTGTPTTTVSSTPTTSRTPFARGGRVVMNASYGADNCFQAAMVQDPTTLLVHAYTYTCAEDGSLASKTDQLTGFVTTYQYDKYGSLRHVGLRDGRTIDYHIDPANRRVGKTVCDGGTCTRTQSFLYEIYKPKVPGRKIKP